MFVPKRLVFKEVGPYGSEKPYIPAKFMPKLEKCEKLDVPGRKADCEARNQRQATLRQAEDIYLKIFLANPSFQTDIKGRLEDYQSTLEALVDGGFVRVYPLLDGKRTIGFILYNPQTGEKDECRLFPFDEKKMAALSKARAHLVELGVSEESIETVMTSPAVTSLSTFSLERSAKKGPKETAYRIFLAISYASRKLFDEKGKRKPDKNIEDFGLSRDAIREFEAMVNWYTCLPSFEEYKRVTDVGEDHPEYRRAKEFFEVGFWNPNCHL